MTSWKKVLIRGMIPLPLKARKVIKDVQENLQMNAFMCDSDIQNYES
jgi:hypothetical protein